VEQIELECGEGLAEKSALPIKVGQLIAAMADVLEVHMTALDLETENGREEHSAYVKLMKAQQEAADRMRATGEQMEGYRDLPAAMHDAEVMRSPQAAEALERFLELEDELLALLQEAVERDRQVLDELRSAS
jgi:hypothetical protein